MIFRIGASICTTMIALMSTTQAWAYTFNVKNSTELLTAMKSAVGGDTINLTAREYSNVIIRHHDLYNRLRYSSPVTIQSVNKGVPAVFYRMEIIGVHNLILQDIKFVYSASRSDPANSLKPFRLEAGKNITYRRIQFEGYYDSLGIGRGYGLNFKTSDIVMVENCKFDKLYYAFQSTSNTNVTARQNTFTNIGHDAFQIGMTQNLLIENNQIHMKSEPNILHKDMIQIHNAGPGLPTANVTIRGNVMTALGEGNNSHSIFFNNERAVTDPSQYYKNFLIENNEIVAGHVHGISAGHIDGIVIRNNSVRKDPNLKQTDEVYHPLIRVLKVSRNVRVTGNITHKAPSATNVDNAWSPAPTPSGWVMTPNNVIGMNR